MKPVCAHFAARANPVQYVPDQNRDITGDHRKAAAHHDIPGIQREAGLSPRAADLDMG